MQDESLIKDAAEKLSSPTAMLGNITATYGYEARQALDSVERIVRLCAAMAQIQKQGWSDARGELETALMVQTQLFVFHQQHEFKRLSDLDKAVENAN